MIAETATVERENGEVVGFDGMWSSSLTASCLKGKPDIPDDRRDFGDFVHICLWEEIAKAAGVQDQGYIQEFWVGMPILGPIARSGRWPDASTARRGAPT